MTFLTTLKTGGRVALVAAALGFTALAVVPAQAANFSIQLGNNGIHLHDHMHSCLDDRGIYRQLDDSGWDHIKIVRSGDDKVIAVASWHHQWYQLLIDRCSGKIYKKPVDFMHHHDHMDDNNVDFGDFHITLSF